MLRYFNDKMHVRTNSLCGKKLINNAFRENRSYYFKTKYNRTYQHHRFAYENIGKKFDT